MSKDLTAAWEAMTEATLQQTTRKDKSLPASAAASSIPARTGESKPKAGGGRGLASPLTEQSYASRTYHTSKMYTSTDGMVTIERKPIKQMSFKDAEGNDAVFNLAEPT